MQLLAHGALQMHRGWEELVVGIAWLRDQGFDLHLRIAGEFAPSNQDSRACVAHLRNLCPAFGVPTSFELHDDSHPLPSLPIDDATLMVAPWQVPEGPRAVDRGVLAAMAAGLPIVASDVPTIAPAVRHEHEALLVPPGDTGALIASLRRAVTDAELRTRLGGNARSRYAAEFTESCTRAELGTRIRLLLNR